MVNSNKIHPLPKKRRKSNRLIISCVLNKNCLVNSKDILLRWGSHKNQKLNPTLRFIFTLLQTVHVSEKVGANNAAGGLEIPPILCSHRLKVYK
jgi:hypothetical protein